MSPADRPTRRPGSTPTRVYPDPSERQGLVEHPDGWYWLAPDGHQAFGPFETATQAVADRDRPTPESVDEAEAEREAEQTLGVSDAVEERRREETSPNEDGGTLD